MNDYTYFDGYKLVETPYMADKVQARTHKKKRINKKWKKRYGMKDVPWKQFFVNTNDGTIYAHPQMMDALISEVMLKGCTR